VYAIARLLLYNGADINAANDRGATPLMSPAAYQTPDVLRFLIAGAPT
jgi:ankyrin repeat protein